MIQISPDEVFASMREAVKSKKINDMDLQTLTQFLMKITRCLYVAP